MDNSELIEFNDIGLFEVRDQSLLDVVSAGSFHFTISKSTTNTACAPYANNNCVPTANGECVIGLDQYCGNINCTGPATGAVVLSLYNSKL